MNDRRRIRRSSPDAPQGYIPVLTVFVGLVAIGVIAGVGLVGSGSTVTDKATSDPRVDRRPGDMALATSVAPTTALIRGTISTMLFVTTTTPVTTTTSTTSTTLAGPAIDAGGPEVVFPPGVTSVNFTVRSSDPVGVDFQVMGVPAGMSVSPMRATVAQDAPVTLTVRIVNSNLASSGTILLVGSDGTRVPVRVTLASDVFGIAAVAVDPDPPVCGTRSRLVARVNGANVVSVSAIVSTSSGQVRLSLSGSSGGWAVMLPDGRPGTAMSGVVTATDADGTTAAKTFSTAFVDGPGCPH